MQITEVSIAAIVDRNKEEAHFKEVKRQNIGLCQSYANRWLKGERWLPILLNTFNDVWARKIVLSVVNGKVYHSGLKKPLRIKKDKDGIHIGCTYVSNDALIIFDKILKGEIS